MVARGLIARHFSTLAKSMKHRPHRRGYVATTLSSRLCMTFARSFPSCIAVAVLVVSFGLAMPSRALAADSQGRSSLPLKRSEAQTIDSVFICDGPVTVNGTWYPEGLYPGSPWNCWAAAAAACPPDGQIGTRHSETHYGDGSCSMTIDCCYRRDSVAMN